MIPNSKEQVLALINEANDRSFTLADLQFGTPTPYADPENLRNTSVAITSADESFTGTVVMYYRRLELAVMFGATHTTFDFTGQMNDTHDLIAGLNERFELTIEPEDIIFEGLELDGTWPRQCVLHAHPDSFAYLGSVSLTMLQPQPIRVTTAGEVSDAFIGWVLDDGLNDGAFITSEHLNPSRTDFLRLGARARFAAEASAPVPTVMVDADNVAFENEDLYTLSSAVATPLGNWCIDAGVQLGNFDEALATDVYDIEMSLYHSNVNTGQLTYRLENIGPDLYQFRDSSYGGIIPAEYNHEAHSVSAIIDMSVLADTAGWVAAFGGVPVHTNGVPYTDAESYPGVFGFNITSTAKEDAIGQVYIGPDARASLAVDVLMPAAAPRYNAFIVNGVHIPDQSGDENYVSTHGVHANTAKMALYNSLSVSGKLTLLEFQPDSSDVSASSIEHSDWNDTANPIQFSPDGRRFGTNGSSTSYQYFSEGLGYSESSITGYYHYAMAYSPSGLRLATGRASSSRIRILDWNGSSYIDIEATHAAIATNVNSLHWLSETRLLVGMNDGAIRIFDIYGTDLTYIATSLIGDTIFSVSPNGKWIATGVEGLSTSIYLHSVEAGLITPNVFSVNVGNSYIHSCVLRNTELHVVRETGSNPKLYEMEVYDLSGDQVDFVQRDNLLHPLIDDGVIPVDYDGYVTFRGITDNGHDTFVTLWSPTETARCIAVVRLSRDEPVPLALTGDWVETMDWTTTDGPSMTSQERTGNTETLMQMVIDNGTDKMLTFDYKVEGGTDPYNADVLEGRIGGYRAWLQPPIMESKHTCYLPSEPVIYDWAYVKNTSSGDATGQAWVSNIQLEAARDIPGGFYICNRDWSIGNLSRGEYLASEIYPRPFLEPSYFAAMATGPNQTLYAVDGKSVQINFYASYDRGVKWTEELFPGFKMFNECMVFFQDQCYVVLSDLANILKRLYRIVPVNTNGVITHQLEYVLDVISPASLCASDTHMAFIDGHDKLVYTDNGIDWVKETLVPNIPNGEIVPTVLRAKIDLVGNTIYGIGQPQQFVDTTIQAVLFSGELGGIINWSTDFPYGGPQWDYDGGRVSVKVVDNDWFIIFGEIYDYDAEWNSAGSIGTVYLREGMVGPWTVVLYNSGIGSAQMVVDGDKLFIAGYTDSYIPNSLANAAWSVDKGRTWELEVSEMTITGWRASYGCYFTSRADIPALGTPVTPVPALVTDLSSFKIDFDTDTSVRSFHVYDNGDVLFTHSQKYVNGLYRACLTRVNSEGVVDTTLNADLRNGSNPESPSQIVVQNDGKILAIGPFNVVNGVSGNQGLTRLNPDGTTDATFTVPVFVRVGSGNEFSSVSVLPDGKILVAGNFITVNGLNHQTIVRLNTDGSVDTTFNCAVTKKTASSMTVGPAFPLANGQIVGSGTNTNLSTAFVVNADGTLVAGFNIGTNAQVMSVVECSDGSVLMTGYGFAGTGIPTDTMLRFSSKWVLDAGFAPDPKIVPTWPCRVAEIAPNIYMSVGNHHLRHWSFNDLEISLRFFDGDGTWLQNFSSVNVGSNYANGYMPEVTNIVVKNQTVYLGGNFITMIQDEWPRTHKVIRRGLARFDPVIPPPVIPASVLWSRGYGVTQLTDTNSTTPVVSYGEGNGAYELGVDRVNNRVLVQDGYYIRVFPNADQIGSMSPSVAIEFRCWGQIRVCPDTGIAMMPGGTANGAAMVIKADNSTVTISGLSNPTEVQPIGEGKFAIACYNGGQVFIYGPSNNYTSPLYAYLNEWNVEAMAYDFTLGNLYWYRDDSGSGGMGVVDPDGTLTRLFVNGITGYLMASAESPSVLILSNKNANGTVSIRDKFNGNQLHLVNYTTALAPDVIGTGGATSMAVIGNVLAVLHKWTLQSNVNTKFYAVHLIDLTTGELVHTKQFPVQTFDRLWVEANTRDGEFYVGHPQAPIIDVIKASAPYTASQVTTATADNRYVGWL